MQVLRNKSKYKGFKRIIYSIKYSLDGLVYAYKNETSLLIHGVLSIVGILLGLVLGLSHTQWGIVLITLAVILAFELINTAMEACIDMITLQYHELAKVAKDCCSAATFVMTLCALVIFVIIYGPKILALLSKI